MVAVARRPVPTTSTMRTTNLPVHRSRLGCQKKKPLCLTFVPNHAFTISARLRSWRKPCPSPSLNCRPLCPNSVPAPLCHCIVFAQLAAALCIFQCMWGPAVPNFRSRPATQPLTCFLPTWLNRLRLRWCKAARPPSQPLSQCCGPGPYPVNIQVCVAVRCLQSQASTPSTIGSPSGLQLFDPRLAQDL